MHNSKKKQQSELLTTIGEVRTIDGVKTLVLSCVEPEYKPRKKHKSKGHISKAFKNRY